MWTYITALVFIVFLIVALIYYVRKDAEKSVRLIALKRELQERQRGQMLIDDVRNMDERTVRNRLHGLANKYQR